MFRIAADPEPILRTHGVRQEYTLIGMPIHGTMHTHTPRAIQSSQSMYQYVFGTWEETIEPRGITQKHGENMQNPELMIGLGTLEL